MGEKEIQITNKHILSLASVLLCAPFIFYFLKNDNYDLSGEDKKFIQSYIYYGNIIILIILLASILGLFSFFQNLGIYISYFIMFLSGISICMIIIGVFYIFSNKIIWSSIDTISYKTISSGNLEIFFYYLPIYNIYLRYKQKPDINSYWRLKESIILRTIFVACGLNGSSNLLVLLILFFIIFRVTSLLGGIDFISDNWKERFDSLFERNLEEIYGYLLGSLIFCYQIITNYKKFNNNEIIKRIWFENLDYYKKKYSFLYPFETNYWFWAEYGIFGLLLIYLFSIEYQIFIFSIDSFLNLLIWIILFGRYLIMINYMKFPPIPIIHEIIQGIKYFLKY